MTGVLDAIARVCKRGHAAIRGRVCGKCLTASKRAWVQRNRVRENAAANLRRRRLHARNPEKAKADNLAHCRKYRESHHEAFKAYQRGYYAKRKMAVCGVAS